MTASLPASVLSGLVARAITTVGTMLLTPVYLHLLGLDAYGWIGLYLMFAGLSAILDLGLGQAVTRDIAQCSGAPDAAEQVAQRLAAFAPVFAGAALVLGLAIGAGGGVLVEGWLAAPAERSSAAAIFWLMGAGAALQFVAGLYVAALNGLHRQPAANAAALAAFAVRGAGAVLLLAFVSATPEAFFAWQVVAAALHLLLVRALVLRGIGRRAAAGARFDAAVLKRARAFAAGVAAANAVGALVQQADKLALTSYVSIAAFAAYSLASQIVVGLQLVSSVFFAALFSRLAASESGGAAEVHVFRNGAQALAVIALPLAAAIGFLPRATIYAWTADAALAEELASVLPVLVLGAALNAAVVVPYTALLARGKSTLALALSGIQAVAFVALLPPLVSRVGLEGAALASALGQAVLIAAYVVAIRGEALGGGVGLWLRDWLPAALVSSAVGGAAALGAPASASRLAAGAYVCGTLLSAAVAAAAVTPVARRRAVAVLRSAAARLTRARYVERSP